MSLYLKNMMDALTVKAICADGFNSPEAMATAKFGQDGSVTRLIKSWAMVEDSADARAANRDLLELSARKSLLGQINAVSPFRRVPFNMHVLSITTGSSAGFVADGNPIGINSVDLTPLRLVVKKIGAICPLTSESAKSFDASSAISADLTRAIAIGESQKFFSQDAETADSPAGILSGSPVQPTSNYLGAIPAEDIDLLVEAFQGDLSTAVLLTSSLNGYRLNKPHNATNPQQFLDTGSNGGDVAGIRHITNPAIPNDKIALIDPARIVLAQGSGVEIDVASYGSLAVTNSVGEINQISLMQTNTMAYRIVREINWKASSDAVVWLAVNWEG